ncbi:hypothetical protein AAFF_G00389070 [Aldrovandia affinis]|uniref:Uncharacterized protein n=1 Tax=Aldrovandia affinis TaxID=143900 RepID=A0AAD7WLC5_9TELE|nr:hypothetical protein AAFF_G00389070 [Aldrovandia affinis]
MDEPEGSQVHPGERQPAEDTVRGVWRRVLSQTPASPPLCPDSAPSHSVHSVIAHDPVTRLLAPFSQAAPNFNGQSRLRAPSSGLSLVERRSGAVASWDDDTRRSLDRSDGGVATLAAV